VKFTNLPTPVIALEIIPRKRTTCRQPVAADPAEINKQTGGNSFVATSERMSSALRNKKDKGTPRRILKPIIGSSASMVLLIGDAPCRREAPRSLPYLSRSLRRDPIQMCTSKKMAGSWPKGEARWCQAIVLPRRLPPPGFSPVASNSQALDKSSVRLSPSLRAALESQTDFRGEHTFPLGFNGELSECDSNPNLYALRSHYHAGSPPNLRDSLLRKGPGRFGRNTLSAGRSKVRHAGEGRLKLKTVQDITSTPETGETTVFTCINPNTGPNRLPKKLVALRKWGDMPGW
jgi:hypothetical protein